MNVLISAYTCCPNKGSEPGNGWNWIINYHKNNYSIIVFTSGKYENEIKSFLKNTELPVDFKFIDTSSSLLLLKIPLIGIYLHYFCWLFCTRRQIRKINVSKEISHGHHVTYSSIKFGTPLYNLGYPIVIGPLGGAHTPDKSLIKYFGNYWKGEIIKEFIAKIILSINPFVRKSIKEASILLVSNKKIKNILSPYQGKAKVIEMFDAGLSDYYKISQPIRHINQNEIRIFWAGRMLPRKGLNLAIETFKELVNFNENINYSFIIAGSGPLENECKHLASTYGLDDKITFLGQISHEQLLQYYCNSHIFLFPSLKDSCPMQIFEAMATGLPIVTLNHQGMADQVVPGTGVMVNVKNGINYPVELANAVRSILKNEQSYKYYSDNAYKFGQSQVWSGRIKEFIDNNL